MRFPVHPSTLAAILIGIACCSGCAETLENLSSFGSVLMMRKTPEETLGIKTPADRIKELQQLTKTVKKKPPAEQQQLVDALAKEFQHENEPIVRRHILRTLAACPPPAAGAVIVGALADSDVETRRTACAALGTRGDKEAVTELTRALSSDTDPDVRIAAVRALGHTRDAAALAPLAEAMVDPNPAMQELARESLTAVSGRDYGNNVQAWREYAKNGSTTASEVSIAERLRRSLF